MVVRFNQLFDQVGDFENLLMAWKKARQGTGWNSETHHFNFHLERQLFKLQYQIQSETYQPGQYRYFNIRDPKPRIIAVAPFVDRVVHHALVQVLMPIFERIFIFDSYATRAGKGTHCAIKRAQKFIRIYPWFYKMDIQHFFENVDHDIMLKLIAKKIKDQKVMRLTEKIIRNVDGNKGLPIGNLTSQFFANVYLNPLDHFIKEVLHIKGYLRYMDDFCIFGFSRNEVIEHTQKINQLINQQLNLTLKQKACWLNKSASGLTFLGMSIFPGMIRVNPENKRRCLKKLKHKHHLLLTNRIDEQQFSESACCAQAHLNYFCPNLPIVL